MKKFIKNTANSIRTKAIRLAATRRSGEGYIDTAVKILIAVVLGAPSSKERFEAATTLLDYGFAAYRAAPVPLPEDRPLQLKVKGSTEETVPLDYAALPQTALLPAESAGQLTVQLSLPEVLEAPVTRGQTVGKAQLLCGEAVQGEYPVCAAADAPRMDFDTALQLLWDSLRGAAA